MLRIQSWFVKNCAPKLSRKTFYSKQVDTQNTSQKLRRSHKWCATGFRLPRVGLINKTKQTMFEVATAVVNGLDPRVFLSKETLRQSTHFLKHILLTLHHIILLCAQTMKQFTGRSSIIDFN